MPPRPGAFLLTGGASRRMQTDKARLAVGPSTLAQRVADLLLRAAAPVVEVGPGVTTLPALADLVPGQGPLAAVAGAWSRLSADPGPGDRPAAMLVVACDLPRLTGSPLRVLAGAAVGQGDQVVLIPEVDGHLQLLCARYPASALDRALDLVQSGARSFRDLLAVVPYRALPAGRWRRALTDVDTPEDLDRLGLVRPGPGHRP